MNFEGLRSRGALLFTQARQFVVERAASAADNRSYGKESVALGCLRLDKRPMGISTVFISSAFISGPNIGLLLTDAKVWIGRKANIQIWG